MLSHPHSPRVVNTDIMRIIDPLGLDSLTIEKDAEGPSQVTSALLHGSLLVATGSGVKVRKSVGDRTMVGDGSVVFVGNGVCVGTSVGGIAACVSATIVNATARDVLCRLTGSVVGIAGAPHALTKKASNMM